MLRRLHALPGLLAALLLMVVAISGAVLSLDPALERAGAVVPERGAISVAELAARVAAHYPGVERIERSASGTVVVHYRQGDVAAADRVDPRTGQGIAPYRPSPLMAWVRDLHRALLLGDSGRAAVGVAAALMAALAVSGALMLAARLGGWRHLLRPVRGANRLHAQIGRAALLGLLLSALTGGYLSAVRFGLLAEPGPAEPAFPPAVSGGSPAPVGSLAALAATDLLDLRELVFPYPNDPNDFYSLRSSRGAGFIDQASGEFLSYQPRSAAGWLPALAHRLHAGEGLWWLGLILGLSALAVPVLALTGALIWWRRRRARPRLSGNCAARRADTVILVGSEGNTTWGFAAELHHALGRAGYRVHTAPMNQLARRYRRAERLLVLAATYGDGAAPASARRFLGRLARMPAQQGPAYAVLGFGDRGFARYCGYAKRVDGALQELGWPRLLPLARVDRQSSQAFTRWGEALGARLDVPLELAYTPPRRRSHTLQLAERVDYGAEVEAPTCVLRFVAAPPHAGGTDLRRRWGGGRLPAFEAGDLVGIVPPGSTAPRFYSLASASADGLLEICVRYHPGGLCSGLLHGLRPGDTIEGFIQPNPQFRPASGRAPVILIGAGTGIGPLAGFVRHNRERHPMYLYWGGRSPRSDFLYQRELEAYLADRRLSGLSAAFSRAGDGSYVQDKLAADAEQLRRLVRRGAQILVCGGREMAAGVAARLDEILAPLQLSVQQLQTQGRYREDVY